LPEYLHGGKTSERMSDNQYCGLKPPQAPSVSSFEPAPV
jgi:hypothetical protein